MVVFGERRLPPRLRGVEQQPKMTNVNGEMLEEPREIPFERQDVAPDASRYDPESAQAAARAEVQARAEREELKHAVAKSKASDVLARLRGDASIPDTPMSSGGGMSSYRATPDYQRAQHAAEVRQTSAQFRQAEASVGQAEMARQLEQRLNDEAMRLARLERARLEIAGRDVSTFDVQAAAQRHKAELKRNG